MGEMFFFSGLGLLFGSKTKKFFFVTQWIDQICMMFKSCVLENLLLAWRKVHIAKMRLFFKMGLFIRAMCFPPFAHVQKEQNGPRGQFGLPGTFEDQESVCGVDCLSVLRAV